MEGKDNIHLVVIGHEGCGKSTTIGNLIYQKGGIDPLLLQQHELEAMDIKANQSTKYAWVINKLTNDRRNNPLSFEPLSSRSLKIVSSQPRSVGLDEDTTSWRIETDSRLVSIIDAPGHPNFLRNMITGASQAHAALLVISALEDEFSLGFSVCGQAREHLTLTHHLGVRELVIAVNKMDEYQFCSDRYTTVVDSTKLILSDIGYDTELVRFVPISGSCGDNLVSKSSNFEWYKGWYRKNGDLGFSLLDAIDDISLEIGPSKDGPFRLAVQDVFQILGVGSIVVGKIESGTLVEGMDIIIVPSQVRGKVTLIEKRQKTVSSAGPGDQIGFHVEGLTSKQVRRGYVCCDINKHPLSPVKEFKAQIAVLPGVYGVGSIKEGLKVRLDCHNTHMDVTFASIDSAPICECVNSGDIVCVTLVAESPISLDLFSSCPPLGRFALRYNNHTVAVGLVIGLESYSS